MAGGRGPDRSIVGVSGAMRARDVARPTPEDESRAEKAVVLRQASGPPVTAAGAARQKPRRR